MELVEGPTLAARIAGGAIPVEEALPLARQIAEALEYAHEHGVIHRDLKPANIKLTPDGQVKVLDFGLAKALQQDDSASSVSADFSPTLSLAATKAGIILGTAAYMAPEQARGKQVDRRADIWSFGVVLYEMLSGQRAFSGEDISVTLANVIKEDPDWAQLPAQLPAQIRRLLRRCLTKDPRNRLRDIGEARIAIEEAISAPQGEAVGATTMVAAPAARSAWIPWAAAGVLGLALAATLWALWPRSAPPAPPVRLNVQLSADVSIVFNRAASVVLSPDGTTVAFLAQKPSSDPPRLFLRRLDQLEATALSATEGARHFFFSPDGKWIGFFANDKLKKISATGGAAVTLCDAPEERGGWWGEDDTIVFGANRAGLSRISAAGGKAEPLTKLDDAAGEATHRWPQVLPGGKAVLFTAHGSGNYDEANLVVQVLATGERKTVQRGGYYARYVPSGHLLYINQGTLFAAPFDLERLETTGQSVPALEQVSSVSGAGGARYALSGNGSLLYLKGADTGDELPIYWMDREGKFTSLRAQPGIYWDIRLSPDGRRLAIQQGVLPQTDIWVYEWARDTMTRLTFDPGTDGDPAWSPDGRRIAFVAARGGAPETNLYWKNADGTGDEQRLTESKNSQFFPDWHPAGKYIAFSESNPQTSIDIWILPIEGDEKSGWKPGKPSVFLNSPFTEVAATFSPDGRWLAYMSIESGRMEVYVRPFPGPGGKWQISTEGGSYPTWSRNGRELFYRSDDQRIMVATYSAVGDSFRADKPKLWSPGQFTFRGNNRNFDVHPDGKRFAVLKREESAAEEKRDHAILILNFFDELRRIAPPGSKSAK